MLFAKSKQSFVSKKQGGLFVQQAFMKSATKAPLGGNMHMSQYWLAAAALAACLGADAQDDGHHVIMRPATSGLGMKMPSAPDVSTSAGWHVYYFRHNNVNYFQVSDLSGTVRMAVASANRQFLILPIGSNYASVYEVELAVPDSRVIYHGQGVEISQKEDSFYVRNTSADETVGIAGMP